MVLNSFLVLCFLYIKGTHSKCLPMNMILKVVNNNYFTHYLVPSLWVKSLKHGHAIHNKHLPSRKFHQVNYAFVKKYFTKWNRPIYICTHPFNAFTDVGTHDLGKLIELHPTSQSGMKESWKKEGERDKRLCLESGFWQAG